VAGIRVFFWAWRCAAWAKSAAPRRRASLARFCPRVVGNRRAANGAPDFELATGRVFAPSARPPAERSEETQVARQAPPEPRGAGIWLRACPLDSFDGLARVLQ